MFTDNTAEMAQNKLLLLYIINESPYSFSKNQLTEFILEKNYMNYFFLQQYLSELIETDFIKISTEDEDAKYIISEKGKITLKYFDTKIPKSIKQELETEFNTQKLIQKKEAQVFSEYFQKEDNQYTVNLKLVENEDVLFSLYLNVASAKQAKMICQAWKEKPDSIYRNIINLFIQK